jgi:hypothetical protein
MDLTQYRIGAVPLDACRNHAYKIDKYRFFADFYIFHSLSYTDWCEKMNYTYLSLFRWVKRQDFSILLYKRLAQYIPEYSF